VRHCQSTGKNKPISRETPLILKNECRGLIPAKSFILQRSPAVLDGGEAPRKQEDEIAAA